MKMEGLLPGDDPANWSKYLHEETKAKVLQDWDNFVQDCSARSFSDSTADQHQMEEIFQFPDRGQRVFDVVSQATRDDNGVLTGFMGFFRDITELRKFRQERDLSLASIDHDTRNAVRALEDVLDQLRQQMETPHGLQLIAVGTTCLKTIEDLAKIARNPHEPQTTQEEFDLCETIESFSVVNMAGDNIGPKRARVMIDESVPRRVAGPRAALMRVLQNLVANAANRPDVSQPQIHLACERVDPASTAVVVAVADDGAGLSNDQAKSLREELQQPIDELRAQLSSLIAPKHGRGLPLYQIWLKAIDSQLDISRGPNGFWNRFSFTIHVKEVKARELDDANGVPNFAECGAVLLVEDDPVWKSTLMQRLMDWGVSPLAVCDRGEDAVQLARDGGFALVLMDIRLPGHLDGYDAARRIREMTVDMDAPPRLISISITEDDKEKRESAGFDAFIRKDRLKRPMDLFELWFPGQTCTDQREPPLSLPSNADLFSNMHAKLAVQCFSELSVIAHLLDAWGIEDKSTKNAIHKWKQKWASMEAMYTRFNSAASSFNPSAELFDLVRTALNELQNRYGVW
jgi:CheY-like chemotaxis protein